LDGYSWGSDIKELPIKFRAEYDALNSGAPKLNKKQQIISKDFVFNNVPATSQADIYLVSSTGALDNEDCPNLTDLLNGHKARRLFPTQKCSTASLSDTPGGNRVCISYSNDDSLTYTYSLQIYSRITKKDCQYDQLYYEWHSNDHSEEATWRCDFLENSCVIDQKPIITPF
jgi:hypothetical protein